MLPLIVDVTPVLGSKVIVFVAEAPAIEFIVRGNVSEPEYEASNSLKVTALETPPQLSDAKA